MRRFLFISLAAGLVACSSGSDDTNDDDITPMRDAGPIRDAGPVAPAVEIGTGQDSFIELMDGDMVEISAGPQGGGRIGGHHIWFALRMQGLNKDDLTFLRFTLTSTDGSQRAELLRNPAVAPIQADPATGSLQLIALAPIIDDCCLVAEQEAIMTTEVETSGPNYTDSVRVRVSRCPGPSEGGPNLCP